LALFSMARTSIVTTLAKITTMHKVCKSKGLPRRLLVVIQLLCLLR
jgi:hypothetical protein